MFINHKKLKFYHWLTNVSPIMFNLERKIVQHYNFFQMAEKSLKFTSAFWLDYKNIFFNIDDVLTPGLNKYDLLALEGHVEAMFQWILRIAIFYWKFLPTMLSEFFQYFPMFDVPFGELEISIFEYWLKLPECVDEIYNVILQNNWSPHIAKEEPRFDLHKAIFGDDSYLCEDVFSYTLMTSFDYNSWLDSNIILNPQSANWKDLFTEVAHARKQSLYILEETPAILISTYIGVVPSNLSNMIKYYFVHKQIYNEDWLTGNEAFSAFLYIFFYNLLSKNLFFTNQLLLVNCFSDFSPRRHYLQASFLSMTEDAKQGTYDRLALIDLKKCIFSRFLDYPDYDSWVKAYEKKPKPLKFPSM